MINKALLHRELAVLRGYLTSLFVTPLMIDICNEYPAQDRYLK